MNQPDIVLCVVDQLRPFELGCYGGPIATPNIDALAHEGARFETAVTNSPLCSPSRAALLSGQYARTCAGTTGNTLDEWPEWNRNWLPDPTLPEVLRDAGYHTSLVGKWHIEAHPLLTGFDDAMYPAATHRYYGQTYRRGGEDQTIDGFGPDFELSQIPLDVDQPLLLCINNGLPHMPIGRGHVPEAFSVGRDDVMLRDNVFLDGAMAHDDWWFKVYTIWDYAIRASRGDPERETDVLPAGFDLKDLTAAYWSAVKCVDDYVGKLRRRLQERDRPCVFVFTSDHGDMLGSHHRFNKNCLFEESIRVPLIISGVDLHPGGIAGLIDVAPTLLDLAGIDPPAHMQGVSLARNQPDEAFIETVPNQIGIRTSDTLLAMTLAEDRRTLTGEVSSLYDLRADPLQTHSLASERERPDLQAKLAKWHRDMPWK